MRSLLLLVLLARADARQQCHHYEPSLLERKWVSAFASAEAQNASFGVRNLCELWRPVRLPADASRMTCGKQQVLIEPLVGLLRNPDLQCAQLRRRKLPPSDWRWESSLKSYKYLREVLDPAYIHLDGAMGMLGTGQGASDGINGGANGERRRAVLLDMGASLWAGGGPGEKEVGATATRWLVKRFGELGVTFDRILTWEATKHTSKELWRNVPLEIASVASFYGLPVSDVYGHPQHPWSVLMRIARPSDLVVVKLDIDTPVLEASLVEQLMSDANVSSRVDVFFWEEHWSAATTASNIGCKTPQDVCIVKGAFHNVPQLSVQERAKYPWFHAVPLSETYQKFVRLRELGILAHPWM